MTQLRVWGGGPYHFTSAQFELFKTWLAPLGFDCVYSEDRSVFEPDNLNQTDILMLMAMDVSTITELTPDVWPDPSKARAYEPLSEKHWQSLQTYLAQGKPLFCHHTGLLCFDERQELAEIYDGRWIVGQSYHPERHEFEVEIASTTHPITRGLSSFKTFDELYTNLVVPHRSEILLQTLYEDKIRPMAWAGKYGESKVVCLTLGHDLKAYKNPVLPKFFINTLQWLIKK